MSSRSRARRVLAWLVPIVFVVLCALSVYMMITRPRPRPVPDDDDHSKFVDVDTCMSCHDPETGVEPRPDDHPEAKVCLDCH